MTSASPRRSHAARGSSMTGKRRAAKKRARAKKPAPPPLPSATGQPFEIAPLLGDEDLISFVAIWPRIVSGDRAPDLAAAAAMLDFEPPAVERLARRATALQLVTPGGGIHPWAERYIGRLVFEAMLTRKPRSKPAPKKE